MFRASRLQRPAQDQKLCFLFQRLSRPSGRRGVTGGKTLVSKPVVAAAGSGFSVVVANLIMAEASDNLSQTFFLCDCSTEASRSQRVSGWARQSSSFDCSAACFSCRPRTGCAIGPLCNRGRVLLRPTNAREEGKLLLRIKPEAGNAVCSKQSA